MEGRIPDLKKLGFHDWFAHRTDPALAAGRRPARVFSVSKNRYTVSDGSGEVPAEITGRLLFSAGSPLDFPVVGDWVYARFLDRDTFAVIDGILPRKTVLKRKAAGKKVAFQVLAANIDTAFIMQSLDANFNLRRLERYLVMVHAGDIRPSVLLSKSDLLAAGELENKLADIHAVMPDVQVTAFSSKDQAGLDRVQGLLVPEQTHCLLGSSGVGKSTLLNTLTGKELFATQQVREKDGRGRHTTARRQLIILQGGALVIDTPGMRELGNLEVEAGIETTFDEIAGLAGGCRYRDCTHIHEDGCAILAAVADGTIAQGRYDNYIKLKKETAYNDMTYYEKRQKDKQFGKMVKNYKKQKRQGDTK